ncbi:MAG: sulfate permease [Prevotellaceae bacterium]|jgi:SulP family sulfate permease|nr:sulfate permease [Prevotellaceae bacterium]
MDNYLKNFKISDVFRPKLFTMIKKRRYNKETFVSDLIAGVIVGIVALPLAIAFGIASGVSPQQGLITAIIAGFIISFFGGTNVLVGGPTGAFMVIVYGIVAEFGMNGLIIATILAGIMLILMGVLKLGNIIKFIPYPIIVGFTSGIAVVIFSSQIKDFFGLTIDAVPSEFIDKWMAYFSHFGSTSLSTTGIALFTVAVIIYWPYVNKKIPGSLVAIIITTIFATLSGMDVETIGSRFPELAGGSSLPSPEAPTMNAKVIRMLIQPAFTIAILGAIESLLAAMVADGVTGKKHHSNTELIAQGVANIVAPIFGGIPATGAIARTMTNINNGGKTPVAGIIHAVVLALIFICLMPLAVHIPLACLAGILVMVAYNMSEWRSFKALLRNPRSDVIVLLTTFFLTVFLDLTIAIEFGLLMAGILFLKRVSETSSISVIEHEINSTEDDEAVNAEALNIPEGVEVYEINGPFFFGLANKFDEFDHTGTAKRARVRVIRMRKVPFIDSTGLHNLRNLWKRSTKEKIQIVLSGVNTNVYATLEKAGFTEELGKEFICSNIDIALKKAAQLLQE